MASPNTDDFAAPRAPTRLLILAALAVFVAGADPGRCGGSPKSDHPVAQPQQFASSSLCRTCHVTIVEQHAQSMHARSFSNPVFRALFYDEFLPEFHWSPDGFRGEPACLACHAPIEYLEGQGDVRARAQKATAEAECGACHESSVASLPIDTPGVTCDFCHRVEGYEGDKPGNANYIASPGPLKRGPFQYASDHHREYSELHTKSEFCAMCHNSSNRFGVPIRTTFDEWKASPYAAQGIQCQDCHMNAQGFLLDGKPVYESGKAAHMTLGRAPEREKLYTHRFVGAHSETQIDGAMTIELRTWTSVAEPGDRLRVTVRVHNEKSGHKMPTGSAELRVAWLEVRAKVGDDVIPVRLGGNMSSFGVTGRSENDSLLFGETVPDGQRIYRAVFLDDQGEQTFFAYRAVKKAFDNRLDAGEVRQETYYVRIPEDVAADALELSANIYYLRYPSAFARRLGLDDCKAVPFASSTKLISLRGAGAPAAGDARVDGPESAVR